MPTQPVTHRHENPIPPIQSIISVMWPSFIMASVATIVFFSIFDPVDLGELIDLPELSRIAGYTGGFFAFWFLTSMSCALTCYFRRPINQGPMSKQEH